MSVAIILENVSAGYGGKNALRDVTLNVGAGERVGLVGPNGAGKTTLFHLLVGLHQADSGVIRLLGLDPADHREVRELRRKAAFVFQNADDQLFSGTVFDDVAFGPLNLRLDDEAVRDRVRTALEFVGADHLADRVGHHLSAGEKRRIALAAALAMVPEILILDEPTGELDPRSRRGFIDLLHTLDHTLLVATHDLEFVLETCERVIVLNEGRVAADGQPRRVLADEKLMSRTGLEVPYSLR